MEESGSSVSVPCATCPLSLSLSLSLLLSVSTSASGWRWDEEEEEGEEHSWTRTWRKRRRSSSSSDIELHAWKKSTLVTRIVTWNKNFSNEPFLLSLPNLPCVHSFTLACFPSPPSFFFLSLSLNSPLLSSHTKSTVDRVQEEQVLHVLCFGNSANPFFLPLLPYVKCSCTDLLNYSCCCWSNCYCYCCLLKSLLVTSTLSSSLSLSS